jgi:hypothetical protein
LLVPREGQLVRVWSFEETAGATWSATEVFPHPPGVPAQIALYSGRFSAEPAAADHLSVSRLIWDRTAFTLRPATTVEAGEPAVALMVGDFASAAEARRHRSAELAVLRPLWVLMSNSVPSLKPGRAALGMVFARRQHAEQERRRLAEGGLSLPVSVVEVTPMVVPK